MSWQVKMNHVDYVNGTASERVLKKQYPTQTQAQETANRLKFVRVVGEETIVEQCVAVAIEQPVRGAA